MVLSEDAVSWCTRLGVFDIETTGVDVLHDRVVTAHVGVLDRAGTITSSSDWLANPGVPIPDQAAAIHGITSSVAQEQGAPAAEVVQQVAARLEELWSQGIPVVVYNAPFDLSLLSSELRRYGLAQISTPPLVIDPLVIDKAWDKYRRGKRTLEVVAAHYQVVLDDAHNAQDDAVAAGRVALALLAKFSDLVPHTARELHDLQVGWARDQASSLEEYLLRVGRLAPGETVSADWPKRA